MSRPYTATALAWVGVLAALAAVAIAGCGGSSGGKGKTAPAGSTAPQPFPAAAGRPLSQVLAGIKPGPILAPAVSILQPGANRFAFVLFDSAREQLQPRDVVVYVADGRGRAVRGPFPARSESLAVERQYQSQTVKSDPDAAKQIYVSTIPMTRAREQGIVVIARMDGRLVSANPTLVNVGGPQPPSVGRPAVRVHTPTTRTQPISAIETRVPPDSMHTTDLADVLGRRPVLLVFATPQLCQSRTCGPVVDEAEQLKASYGSRLAFIHMEIYNGNEVQKGFRPQVKAWRLPSEPWVFAIDRRGRVAARLEGPFSVSELRAAIERGLRG